MNITNELREKLLTAKSAEEAAELLKADGQEVEPDDVEKLWAEVTKKLNKDFLKEEHTMGINREELEKKALKAASAEEVAEIIRAAGEKITDEEAAAFFKKVQERKAEKELSIDELDSVSGGEEFSLVRWGKTFRDYSQEGCAATVEPDSHCWGTDGGCTAVDRVYWNGPIWVKCPDCGVYLYRSGVSYGSCIVCGKGYSLEVSGPRIGSLN